MLALSDIALLAALDQESLDRLAREIVTRRVDRDEQIVFEGEPAHSVYFIAQGQMRVYRLSREGREQVLGYLGPGEAFHLAAALDGGPHPATTSAWTAGVLYVLNRARFVDLLQREPALTWLLLQQFARQLRHLTALAEELGVWTVRARLARLLLEQASVAGAPTRRFTHEEMAAQIGTVREVVGRTLRAFEDEALIHTQRHRIVVVDAAALRAIAQG
ncbi:MAG: Crp/Fnr family transcriptional regulator [Chloroflexi bacterium]|nr:Crp/Fnr family transcriptional regulator [Chloroflexota bacterium]MBU1751214.1 Crp/Fnr family transcriptional regulator [Chloroflexota bacterium]